MNDKMYACPATQEAIRTLASWDNVTMLDCAEGELACGTTGKGRMQEVPVLLEAIRYALTPHSMAGQNVLLTSGPTVEAIDPVRFISNHSTGKMGAALALEAWYHGADVTMISGPVSHLPEIPVLYGEDSRLRIIPVTSAAEMAKAACAEFPKAQLTILCAAVADFTPQEYCTQKIKKQPQQTELSITLSRTADIAATLGAAKQQGQILVGFALETENEQANAQHKLSTKNLDWIVLNSTRDAGAGFGCDTNKVTLFSRAGAVTGIGLQSKPAIARAILGAVC